MTHGLRSTKASLASDSLGIVRVSVCVMHPFYVWVSLRVSASYLSFLNIAYQGYIILTNIFVVFLMFFFFYTLVGALQMFL